MSTPRLHLLASAALLALSPLSNGSPGAAAEPFKAAAPPGSGYASAVPKAETIDNHDGSALATDIGADAIPVAEEVAFVLDNGFRDRGGYDATFRTVASVEYQGTRYVGCDQYVLDLRQARPNTSHMVLKAEDAAAFEIDRSDKGITVKGEPHGLTVEDERALLETFDFETPVDALREDSHALKPLGMQKLKGMLAWKLMVNRPGDLHRIVFIDSHTGDVVKSEIVDAHGAVKLDVALHDFRSVDGVRVPFAIDYRRADGTMVASDRIERVEVKRGA